jgi:hypothetical protein
MEHGAAAQALEHHQPPAQHENSDAAPAHETPDQSQENQQEQQLEVVRELDRER